MNDNYIKTMARQIAILARTLREEGMDEAFISDRCRDYINSVLTLASMSEKE